MYITIDLKETNLFVSVKIILLTTILLFLISCNNGNEKFEQYKKCGELWYTECDSIVENDSTCYRYAVYVDCIKLFFKILEGDKESSYTNHLKIFTPTKEEIIMELKYADNIVTGQIYIEDILDSIRIKNKNPKHHSSLFLEELKKHKMLFLTDPEYEIFISDHYISCDVNFRAPGSDKMFVYVKTPTDKYGLLFSFVTENLEFWHRYNTAGIIPTVENENCTNLFDLVWEETYKHQREQLIRFSESN